MKTELVWPRVGCGAAIVENGELLLVKRRRNPEAGRWGLPGGKVDPFEPVTDATAREIREELGIIIKPKTLLCLVEQVDRAADQHWIAPVFRIEHFEGTPAIMEPDALSEVRWFDLEGLPDELTEATKQAVAALRSAA